MTDVENVVRQAYHTAEGNVLDLNGFKELFTDDGVIHAGKSIYRGDELSNIAVFMGKLAPEVHSNIDALVVIYTAGWPKKVSLIVI